VPRAWTLSHGLPKQQNHHLGRMEADMEVELEEKIEQKNGDVFEEVVIEADEGEILATDTHHPPRSHEHLDGGPSPYHDPRPLRKLKKSKSHVQDTRNQPRRARELFCPNWIFSRAQTRFCARYFLIFPGLKWGCRKPKFKFKMCSFQQDLLQVIWRSFDTSNHQAKSTAPSWR